MVHFAPHAGSKFEGYYFKFDMPSKARIALIVCTVPAAREKKNMVAFTYVPANGKNMFQREIWIDGMEMEKTSLGGAFELRMPGIGAVKGDMPSGDMTYDLDTEFYSLHASTSSRTPWSSTTDTPEALLVNLPLPLHWHVHSLGSDCKFTLRIPSYSALPDVDSEGVAKVHEEKNWAQSFPSAHFWVQAREANRSICLAGGQILGMEAYLLGYRSEKPQYSMDFRPPLALRVGGMSPTMSLDYNWDDRTFRLALQNWRQKIVVEASAPIGTFFSLSAPFSEGFRKNYLGESFNASIKVQVYEASWLGSWQLKHEDSFEHGSLEFAGGYYPPAGSDQCFN